MIENSPIRRHVRFAISVVVVAACIGLVILLSRESDAQLLMQELNAVARDGCPVERLVVAVGKPDKVLPGDQVPQWLVETTVKHYSHGFVRSTDEFLVYERKHNDKRSSVVYLQVRDGHLINVDPEFLVPDVGTIQGLY
jgi:hypothetical protein